jgi:hypothetical protein
MEPEKITSKLDYVCIVGIACLALGIQDLLAWAQITSPESGWLMQVAGGDWMEPIAGLLLVALGIVAVGPAFLSAFSLRDTERKRARRATLLAAFVAAVAALATIESLVPSAKVLPVVGQGVALTRASRQSALMGLGLFVCGIAAFTTFRRKDVGFYKLSVPIERANEIWRLKIKVEVAIRAMPENQEASRLIAQRVEFVQAGVGARFDHYCQPLVKESADLSTIDSTARLQMDVGHVFKRYAEFHRRLADMRHTLCEDLMSATYESVTELLERGLPGQSLRVGVAEGIKVSVSHPVLTDSPALVRRRTEWDDTLRTIVSIGAEKGNEIVGNWIQRAAKGEVSAEEVPAAVEALRALCNHNRGDNVHVGSKLLALGV